MYASAACALSRAFGGCCVKALQKSGAARISFHLATCTCVSRRPCGSGADCMYWSRSWLNLLKAACLSGRATAKVQVMEWHPCHLCTATPSSVQRACVTWVLHHNHFGSAGMVQVSLVSHAQLQAAHSARFTVVYTHPMVLPPCLASCSCLLVRCCCPSTSRSMLSVLEASPCRRGPRWGRRRCRNSNWACGQFAGQRGNRTRGCCPSSRPAAIVARQATRSRLTQRC